MFFTGPYHTTFSACYFRLLLRPSSGPIRRSFLFFPRSSRFKPPHSIGVSFIPWYSIGTDETILHVSDCDPFLYFIEPSSTIKKRFLISPLLSSTDRLPFFIHFWQKKMTEQRNFIWPIDPTPEMGSGPLKQGDTIPSVTCWVRLVWSGFQLTQLSTVVAQDSGQPTGG